MEVHIYSAKVKRQAGSVWVKDITTTSRDCKNFCILLENLAEIYGSRREHCWVTCLSMRIHHKSYCIFPLKVAATLPNGSRKDASAHPCKL